MKQPSILIILLLIAVFVVFYGGEKFYVGDDAAIAGSVRVPVYVPLEQTAGAIGTVVPLRQSPFMQVQAPSVQTPDQLTSGSTGWNLTASSDAQTQSVGGGMSASSEGNMFAASSHLATPAVGNCATALPAITPNRQRTVSALAMTNTDNLVTRRRAAQATGTFDPNDPSTWPEDPWIFDTVIGVDGIEYEWTGTEWRPRPHRPDPTPVGDAPWLLLLGCLFVYTWSRNREKQKTYNA